MALRRPANGGTLCRMQLRLVGLTVALLLTPALVRSQPVTADRTDRTAGWEQDLRLLVSELERKHPDLYHRVSKQQFAQDAARLRQEIPQLDDGALTIGVQRLVASLGDSHTGVSANYQALGFHRLPIAPYVFDDGVYIRDADTSIVHLIGARIVAINGHSIDSVLTRLSDFVAYENEAQLKHALPGQMTLVELLQYAALSTRTDSVSLDIVDAHGQSSTEIIPSFRIGRTVAWGLPSVVVVDSLPLFRRNTDRAYWFEHLAPDSAIYVAYNRAANDRTDPIDAFAERVVQVARASNVTRVIVDFRRNSGGNSGVFGALQRRLVALRNEHKSLQLFGIIGRSTFSSAVMNAFAFQRTAGATLYGEPTGGKPNHFGEVRQFTLPHSKLVVYHSTRTWRLLRDEDPESIMPDVRVPNGASEYFRLRDPVLERILKQPSSTQSPACFSIACRSSMHRES